jgi:hypothetical protein
MKSAHFNICTSASFQGSEVYCRLSQACSGPNKQGIFDTKSSVFWLDILNGEEHTIKHSVVILKPAFFPPF